MYTEKPSANAEAIEMEFRRKAMNVKGFSPNQVRSNGHPRPDGKLIRQLMNQAKMKPRHLAEHIGVDSNKIQLILKGVGTEINYIADLAELLEVRTKDLLKNQGK